MRGACPRRPSSPDVTTPGPRRRSPPAAAHPGLTPQAPRSCPPPTRPLPRPGAPPSPTTRRCRCAGARADLVLVSCPGLTLPSLRCRPSAGPYPRPRLGWHRPGRDGAVGQDGRDAARQLRNQRRVVRGDACCAAAARGGRSFRLLCFLRLKDASSPPLLLHATGTTLTATLPTTATCLCSAGRRRRRLRA